MKKRDLIIYLPVVHRGYLEFFEKKKKEIASIYILAEDLIKAVSDIKPDIASIQSKKAVELLRNIGLRNISILRKAGLKKVSNQLLLVDDEISRAFKEKYLKNKDVKFEKVFLRWDKASVISTPVTDSETTSNPFDKKMMREAYIEAEKSSDWWRQVGAVLVKNKRIILRSYNKGIPSDHTPYQIGAVRDFLNVGEKPELSSTIHAEQVLVATAAKNGLSLEGASIYLTHFPCSVCAKLIALSGIKKCYFGEGSSNIDGKSTMESRGIKISAVKDSSAKS